MRHEAAVQNTAKRGCGRVERCLALELVNPCVSSASTRCRRVITLHLHHHFQHLSHHHLVLNHALNMRQYLFIYLICYFFLLFLISTQKLRRTREDTERHFCASHSPHRAVRPGADLFQTGVFLRYFPHRAVNFLPREVSPRLHCEELEGYTGGRQTCLALRALAYRHLRQSETPLQDTGKDAAALTSVPAPSK